MALRAVRRALSGGSKTKNSGNVSIEEITMELASVHGDLQSNRIEMEQLRNLNVALEAQLKEALERIAELEEIEEEDQQEEEEQQSSSQQQQQQDECLRCCIDLEPFKAGDEVFRLPCFHIHHSQCLLPFLKRQEEPECPVCRTPVPVEDIDNLPVWEWQPPHSH